MDPDALGRDLDPESSSSEGGVTPPSISPQLMDNSVGDAASNVVPTGSTYFEHRQVKRSRTSWVWKHYNFVDNFKDKKGIDIGTRAVCRYCPSHFSCVSNSGTGHVERHWTKKHKDECQASGGLSNFSYSKHKMRKGLARYIAATEQPFTFGEDIRFENFIQNELNPSFCKVSRNTTRSDCLKVFNNAKKDLIVEMAELNSTISFTSDLWTGRNNLGYSCVTAHYIDSNWILKKKIIAFRLMEYPHTGNQIFQCINGVFMEYEIVDKVLSITFDNASANDKAIDSFKQNLTTSHAGQFFHMRCVCHIINLVVQDGLKRIGPHIDKIRAAILFISFPSRQQEFEGLCRTYNVKPKKMKSDVKHCWNLIYLMLKSCTNHSHVITAFFNAKHGDGGLTPADWKISFEFMKFLKVFYVATCACSGVLYPTSCIVLNHLYNISFNFSNYRTKMNFVQACSDMEGKFKKYFEDMPSIFIVAAVMDPRIKLEGVLMLLEGISDNLGIILPDVSEVKTILSNIFASYESKFASSSTIASVPLPSASSTTTSTTASVTAVSLPSASANDPSWSLIFRRGKTACSRNDLSRYLEMDSPLTENDNLQSFDISDWWKINETTFPILSIMARDVLTSPVSSVASESAFSVGKRVLDEKRTRLSPDILDCLICLKNWEDARLGIQKRSPKDEFKDYFSDSDIDDVE